MPQTCKTCSRSDVKTINRLLAQGLSLRNIASQVGGGANTGGLKRHKDNCIPDLVQDIIQQRRAGLLADVDDVRERIKTLEAEFADNGQVQVQLIARRLDAIEKEAKLTGAYTKEQENPKNISQIKDEIVRSLTQDGMAEDEVRAVLAKRYPDDLVSNANN